MTTGATTDERIKRLTEFKENLVAYEKSYDPKLRTWLNQNVHWAKREVVEAKCHSTFTISPPPAIGGMILRNIDPFTMMFEEVYGDSLVPRIVDMIDKTIGVLRHPPPSPTKKEAPSIEARVQKGYAFVAMPMDENDAQLVDVLDAIKEAAAKCGISAERVDDVESNDRITDRILESIGRAEFVIVDLTHGRPNVFFEAGFAHGLGKTPIYIARVGTELHFDVKDYPVIIFKNMKELKERVMKRLLGLNTSTK